MSGDLILLLLCRLQLVLGITCYTCHDNDFDGELYLKSDCFYVKTTTKTSEAEGFCRTIFEFRDGLVIGVRRSVATGSMTKHTICRTTLTKSDSRYVEKSSCSYDCNTNDKCNAERISSLKLCQTDCGRQFGQGYCDYITGTCSCTDDNYSGGNCKAAIPTAPTSTVKRKCIQCNSEIDIDCSTQTVGTDCPGTERFCTSAKTSVFTPKKLMRTSIIRGCSDTFTTVDECKFTSIHSQNELTNRGYREFTCYSTCDKDGCNINTPDGVVNGEEKVLFCVQCSTKGRDCSKTRSACPSSAKYCKSTVKYLLSASTDMNYEALAPASYEMLSVVRECATEPVTKGCTETKIDEALSFKMVTCEETCQEDGCNTGWPARPKCIQCSTTTNSCMKNPPAAVNCPNPYDKYCYLFDNGLDESTKATVDGYPRSMVRGCSYIDRGTACSTVSMRDKKIQSCNYTCSTDGCNVGIGSQSFRPDVHFSLTLLIATSSALFYYF